MKKLRYWLISLLFAVVCVCAVAGCGGSKAGTYKLYSLTVGNQTIKAGEEFKGALISFTLSQDMFTVELKDDGSCVVTVGEAAFGSGGAGTWEADENDSEKINLKIGSAKVASHFCDGKELHYDTILGSLVLRK